MRCEQFFDRLNSLMDDRVEVHNDFQLRAHAKECSSCDAALNMSVRLTLSVDSQRDSVVAVDPSVRSRSRSATWAVLTSAALLLIAVSWGVKPTNETMLPQSVVLDEKPEVLNSPDEVSPTVVASVRPMPAVMNESTPFEDVKVNGSSQPAMLHPIFNLGLITRTDWALAIDEFALPIPGRAESIDASWLKTVTEGVSPVQESVNSTLERIRRSVSQVVVNG